MDAADERSTRLGRRRRDDPGTPAPEAEQAESGTPTGLGARRSSGPVEAVEAVGAPTADTQLGARQHRAPTTPAEVTAPTSLGERRRTASDDTVPEPSPVSEDTGLGARQRERGGRPSATSAPSSRPAQDDEVVRFGPGVPARGPDTPTWTTGRTAADKARRRRRPWIGALLTIGLLAAVLAFLLLRQGDPMTVQSVRVDASLAPGTCDTVVDVVGTVATNGQGGTLRYQWQRSDGETSDVLSQSVPDKATTTQVHLRWAVSGRGRFPAQAVLRVLEPTPMESAGGFTYSCS